MSVRVNGELTIVKKPEGSCELSYCVNRAVVFCSAPGCQAELCGRPLVNGERHDRCAAHSKDAPVIRYVESSPSRDSDDSDDQDNSGGSDSKGHKGSAKKKLNDQGNSTTSSGTQEGSDKNLLQRNPRGVQGAHHYLSLIFWMTLQKLFKRE